MLSFLRSQRAVLKLMCYSLDRKNERELLGHVMLDLRAASQSPPYPEKWYPLINTRASSFRPELKICFAVTSARDTVLLRQPREKKSSKISYELHSLGYYQVGNASDDHQFFYTLWITIAFAENLTSFSVENPNKKPYYFYYTLMGNDIRTTSFLDLANPNFPSERVSIRFRSTQKMLQDLLAQLSRFNVHFCHENDIIGSSEIDLSFLRVQDAETSSVVEKVYYLSDSNQALQLANGKIPSIGLSIALTLDNTNPSKEVSTQNAINVPDRPVSPTRSVKSAKDAAVHVSSQPASPLRHVQTESAPMKRPNQFRFSIELRSVRNCGLKSGNIFFKYSYQPFGNSAAVTTGVCDVHELADSNIKNAFCAFEFVMESAKLEKLLEESPLVLEMWHRTDQDAHQVGMAFVNLANVLLEPKKPTEESSIQSLKLLIPIQSKTESGDSLGQVFVILAVEDFGFIESSRNVTNFSGDFDNLPRAYNTAPVPSMYPSYAASSTGETSLHDSPEYKVAMELEIWKEEEKEKFKTELLQNRDLLNSQLAQEWKTRELEREKVLKRKLDGYKTLETQLETLALQLETREKALIEAESLLEKRTIEMEQKSQQVLNEARDASRRLKLEFDHNLKLERKLREQIQAEKEQVVKDKAEKDSQYKGLEAEYARFRKSASQSTESVLQLELAKSLTNVAEMSKQLDESNSKYKETKSKLQKVVKAYNKLKSTLLQNKEKQTLLEHDALQSKENRMQVESHLNAIKDDQDKLQKARADLEMLNHNIAFFKPKLDAQTFAKIEQLAHEKDSLLASGIYQSSDGLIIEMEHRINSLLQEAKIKIV
jgi:centrosomal protein CEP120